MKIKRRAGGEDKNTKRKKLKGVLQFIDDVAAVDYNEPSDDEILEEELSSDFEPNNELQVHQPFHAINDGEEFDKMLEDYCKVGSSLVTVAEYGDHTEPSMVSSAEDPTVWKVKCVGGHEKHTAFCIMQKYVDLKPMGTALRIISVITFEHIRGFIFIEAYNQWHINEACKGICNIYCNTASPVPENELLQLLHVRSKCTEVSVGMWVRLKNGIYKGDLAKVVALNKSHKKATVKLVPRIDLQALAEKFGRGVSNKKTAIPRARLISSTELDNFRPLIQHKRDGDLGEVFEVLDRMMFKDGYLFKKVPVESLIFWGFKPSENELLAFEQSGGDESKDLEWLHLLYGEQNARLLDNKGVRGDFLSTVCGYKVHDLVFFGSCSQEHFGVIIEVGEASFKILKENFEAPEVVTIKQDQLRKAFFNKKLTALDHHMKTVRCDDSLKVLEGPLKDRQGVIKHIYRGTVFLQDENEQENSGYFCCKAQNCENLKTFVDGSNSKGVELQVSGSQELISSLHSLVLDKKRSNSNPKLENKDGKFSIGQSLTIRVGPLKGYHCRVMAIQETNVTVKLDSQHKILTVECEKLCVSGEKKPAISKGSGVPGPSKSSNLLGIPDGTKGRFNRVAMSVGTPRMRSTTGLSNRRINCPGFPASTYLLRRAGCGFDEQSRVVAKENSGTVTASRWRGGIKKPMGMRQKIMGFGNWKKKNEEMMFGRGGGVRRSSAAAGGSQPHSFTFRGQQTRGGRNGGRGTGRAVGTGGWKGAAQLQAPSGSWRKQVGGRGCGRAGVGGRGGGGRGGVGGRGVGGGCGAGVGGFGGCGVGGVGGVGGHGGFGGVGGRGCGVGRVGGFSRGGFGDGRGGSWNSIKGFGGSSNSSTDEHQSMETSFKQNIVVGGRGRGRASFPRGYGQRSHTNHKFHN